MNTFYFDLLKDEDELRDTFYERSDLKQRRLILKETVHKIAGSHQELKKIAESNLNRWKDENYYESSSELNNRLEVGVYNNDWGVVTKDLTELYGETFIVLNMANSYVPGGGYLLGLTAQEENMFRRTDCHFSISPKDIDVNGQYIESQRDLINGKDGLVYLDTDNPRICLRGPEDKTKENLGYEWLNEKDIFPFYEMRSAAVDLRNNGTFNYEESKKRVYAQFRTMRLKEKKHVVLGAHGCGAFLNPPFEIAAIYKEMIELFKDDFVNISFAILNDQEGSIKYQTFKSIIMS